jgi:hypothetical protein
MKDLNLHRLILNGPIADKMLRGKRDDYNVLFAVEFDGIIDIQVGPGADILLIKSLKVHGDVIYIGLAR